MTTATQPRTESAALPAWFDEFRRLVAEAEERFNAGEVLPTLASLAAIPNVHRVLIDGCGELLATAEVDAVDDAHCGLYL